MSNIGPGIGVALPSYVGRPSAGAGPAGWHLVAKVGATGTASAAALTVPVNTSGADLIVIAAGAPTGTITCSDNLGNVYTSIASVAGGSSQLGLFYCSEPVTGASHTFTLNETTSAIGVVAWSGSHLTPLDQHNSATYTTATAQPGSITPTQSNELIVSALAISFSASTLVIDSSFTIQEFEDGASGVNYGVAIATLVQAAAAAINPTWTRGATGGGSADGVAIASFFGA